MIKVRTAGFPGMRPSNYNIDEVVVFDYYGGCKHVIRSKNANLEFCFFPPLEGKKVLNILDNTPIRPKPAYPLVPEPSVSGRDLFAAAMGAAAMFTCLVIF